MALTAMKLVNFVPLHNIDFFAAALPQIGWYGLEFLTQESNIVQEYERPRPIGCVVTSQ
jgi:hypothetical protein